MNQAGGTALSGVALAEWVARFANFPPQPRRSSRESVTL